MIRKAVLELDCDGLEFCTYYTRGNICMQRLCDLKSMQGNTWARGYLSCPWPLFYLLIYHRKSSCELKVYLKRPHDQRACLLGLLSPRSIATPHLLLTLHKEVGQVHPTVTTAFTLWPSANKGTGCLSALLDAMPCKDWPLWSITEYNLTPRTPKHTQTLLLQSCDLERD